MLIAVDGSEASMRAVEHVANTACGCRGFELTLYHVVDLPPSLLEHGGGEASARRVTEKHRQWSTQEEGRVERTIFAPAKQILRNGTAKEGKPIIRVLELAEAHPDVAQAILEEAHTGGYDVIVLGRGGHSGLKEILFGSVTAKVIHHLEDKTVWIVA
jgi:nucleotide-binding universal stress UspA family protein